MNRVRLMTEILRYTPFIVLLVSLIGNIELISNIGSENYTEYQDELGNALYIVYDTPLASSLSNIFGISYFMLLFVYVCSHILKFCEYYRLGLYYLFVVKLFNDSCSSLIVDSDVALKVAYSTTIVCVIFILTSVYLHLLHLAKVKRNKANQAPK